MPSTTGIFRKDPRTGLYDCSILACDLSGLRMWKTDCDGSWKVSLEELRRRSSSNDGELKRGKCSTFGQTEPENSQALANVSAAGAELAFVSPDGGSRPGAKKKGSSLSSASSSSRKAQALPSSGAGTGARFCSPETGRYKITLKSFLLAQATERFLRQPLCPTLVSLNGPICPEPEPSLVLKLCRKWHRYDAKASASLSTKNAQAYYSNILCTKNCFEVCSKLNEVRASGFGGCCKVKRGKKGRKIGDAEKEQMLFLKEGEVRDLKNNRSDSAAGQGQPAAGSVVVVTPPPQNDHRLPHSVVTPRGSQLGLPPTPLFLKDRATQRGPEAYDRQDYAGGAASPCSSSSSSSSFSSSSSCSASSTSSSEAISPGCIGRSILASSIVRGSYSEHITGFGDALSCIENYDEDRGDRNLGGDEDEVVEAKSDGRGRSGEGSKESKKTARKAGRRSLSSKKNAAGKKKAASAAASRSDAPAVSSAAAPAASTTSKKKKKKSSSQKTAPPKPPFPPAAATAEGRVPRQTDSNISRKSKNHHPLLDGGLGSSPSSSADVINDMALIQTLNKKCSDLAVAQEECEYETKLRSDAQAATIIAERNLQMVNAELKVRCCCCGVPKVNIVRARRLHLASVVVALIFSPAGVQTLRCIQSLNFSQREKQRTQNAQEQASKAQTSLLCANESLLRAKQANKDHLKENELMKEKLREVTGKGAAAEAFLESERERNKVCKVQISELKAAIRKLATLKESGEYTPRSADGSARVPGKSPPSSSSSDGQGSDRARAMQMESNFQQQLKQMKNENIYLRRQVASEIQCKKELQSVVDSQNARLQAANLSIRNLEGRVSAREAMESDGGEQDNDERTSQSTKGPEEDEGSAAVGSNHPLTIENASLRQELKEMTECYQSSRQNLGVTQKALEKAREINSAAQVELALNKSKLAEARDELETAEKHRDDVIKLLQNKVVLAEKKAEEVERRCARADAKGQADESKRLSCLKLAMVAGGGGRQNQKVRSAYFKWAFFCAKREAICAKDDAQIQAVTEREAWKKELSRAKKEKEKESAENVGLVKKKAAEHIGKVKEEMKKVLEAKDSELRKIGEVEEALRGRLKVAGEDREALKCRISELQMRVKKVEEERAIILEEREVEVKKMVAQLELKAKLCEKLEWTVKEGERRMGEDAESMKGKFDIEMGKALLELEKKLRAEKIGEDAKSDEKWTCKINEVERSRLEAEERSRAEVRKVQEECKRQVEQVEGRWKVAVEELKVSEGERRDRDLREEKREADRRLKDAVSAKEKEMLELSQAAEKDFEGKIGKLKLELEEGHAAQVLKLSKERDEQFKKREAEAELQIRIKLGEERARSSRAIQRAREESEEGWAAKVKAEVKEVEERLGGQVEEKVELLNRKQKEWEAEKRAAMQREAKKWEKALEDAVEAGEKRRFEETEGLKKEYESRIDVSRKKVADAAKKAIEEARRRYLECKKEEEASAKSCRKMMDTVESLERELKEEGMKRNELEGKVVDLMSDAKRAEESLSARAASEESTRRRVEQLESEVRSAEAEGKKQFGEGVARGLEDGSKESKKIKEMMLSHQAEWEAEKSSLLAALDGWKERGRVWSDQAEMLDKEIEGSKAAAVKLRGENATLAQGIERVSKQNVALEEEAAGLSERVKAAEKEGMKRLQKARVDYELKVEERVKEAVELGAQETSRAMRGFEEKLNESRRKLDEEAKLWEREKKVLERSASSEAEARERMEATLKSLRAKLGNIKKEHNIEDKLAAASVAAPMAAAGRDDDDDDEEEKEEKDALELEKQHQDLKVQIASKTEKGKEIAKLIQECEGKIAQHGNSGSLSPGGTLSLSHVKMKRRLNEELEGYLSEIDKNRRAIKKMNAEILKVIEKRVEVERGSKARERKNRIECEIAAQELRNFTDKILQAIK